MITYKKVAIVHDWIVTLGGAENCLAIINEIFPSADIYTIVSSEESLKKLDVKKERVHNSFIQKFPKAQKKYRSYLPFFPLAIEQFDLSKYDLILSSSHAVAKAVLTHANQLHICYCHSPIRYAWDLHHQYLRESGLDKGMKGWIAKFILHYIRNWDVNTHNRVDHFIANSKYIGKRINRVYRRDSDVIYPPVNVKEFTFKNEKEDFYLTASRMVPYKKMDLIVEAFAHMPDKKLVVIGTGPDFDKIKSKAGDNIKLMGYQSFEVLKDHMQRAKAFVFAAEEDFGIIPVEAQACGTPVIAFGKGGATETVIDGVTGVHFKEQTVESIISAISRFENTELNPIDARIYAEKFSEKRYKLELINFINKKYKEFYPEKKTDLICN